MEVVRPNQWDLIKFKVGKKESLIKVLAGKDKNANFVVSFLKTPCNVACNFIAVLQLL